MGLIQQMSFTQRLQKPAALHLMAAPVTEASVLFEERQKEQVDCGGWTAAPKAWVLRPAWHGYTGPHTTWEMAPSGGDCALGFVESICISYLCISMPKKSRRTNGKGEIYAIPWSTLLALSSLGAL